MSHDEDGKPDDLPVDEEFDLPSQSEVELRLDARAGAAASSAATLPGVAGALGATFVGELTERGAPPSTELRQAWERLWVASLQSPWTSLALVPAVPGVSVRGVAEALVRVGGEYRGQPVELVDAHGLRMSEARALGERVGAVRERHAFVVTLDCPLESQSALVVARAASAALLVVPVGPTPLAEARRTIETVGRPRFIGAVTFQPRSA